MNRLDHFLLIVIILLIGTCFYLLLTSNVDYFEDEPHTSTIRTDYIIKDGIIKPKTKFNAIEWLPILIIPVGWFAIGVYFIRRFI